MIELTKCLQLRRKPHCANISLSGWLCAMVGNYYVNGEGGGYDEFHWLSIYYDAEVDTFTEAVEQTHHNLVAYVSSDYKWCFVLDKHARKFKKDTADYGLCYISVEDFGKEMLKCSNIDLLPQEFSNIVWIDDDFMNNETIPFDFDNFALIDDHVPYLNPKHFSVGQLIMVMNS